MTLEKINVVFQMLAAIAVVASLVYLAIQTRQAAQNAKAAIHENRAATIVGHIDHMIDPNFAPIWMRGLRADPNMSDEEVARYTTFVGGLVMVWEERFRQKQEGMLDESRWATSESSIALLTKAPGFRAAIKTLRRDFDADFAVLMDKHIAQGRAASAGSGALAWRAAAAEELAAMPAPSVAIIAPPS